MDFIEIEFIDFDKLVKRRKEITAPQWFALGIDILLHPDFIDVTGDEFKAFVWIVSTAAKLNKEKIKVYPKLCSRQTNISEKSVLTSIEKLNGKRFHVKSGTHESHTCDTQETHEITTTPQDKTLHNKTLQDNTATAVVTRVTPAAAEFKNPSILLENIPRETWDRWRVLYQDDGFIKREFIKAHGWYFENPKKIPKSVSGWCRALSSWLERGWTYRAKATPGKMASGMTSDEILRAFEGSDDNK